MMVKIFDFNSFAERSPMEFFKILFLFYSNYESHMLHFPSIFFDKICILFDLMLSKSDGFFKNENSAAEHWKTTFRRQEKKY